MKFLQYLKENEEAVKGPVNHLDHIEDVFLVYGNPGLRIFSESIQNFMNFTSHDGDKSFLSLKVDGSPAIVFGKDDNGRFFLSTKSIFNKTPKVMRSIDDAELLFTSGIVEKMKIAWEYLSDLKYDKGESYQADILFTEEDLQIEEIDGEEYITFQPNTLKYAIKNNEEFEGKFAIAIHTKYNTVHNEDGSYELQQQSPDFSKIIDQTEKKKDLLILDTKIEGSEIQNKVYYDNVKEIQERLIRIQNMDPFDPVAVQEMEPQFWNLLRIFINKNVEFPDHGIFGDRFFPDKFLKRLVSFIEKRLEKEKEKLKTDGAKNARKETSFN